jgi:hypothetical protein
VSGRLAQEPELVAIEPAPAGLAVEGEDSPRRAGGRAQADERLLLAPNGWIDVRYLALRLRSPLVASCSVATPRPARATSASLLTSSS